MVGFILDCGRGQPVYLQRIGMDKGELWIAYLCPWTTFSSVSCQPMLLREPMEMSIRMLQKEICRENIDERAGLPWLLGADEPDGVIVNAFSDCCNASVGVLAKVWWRWNRPFSVGLSTTSLVAHLMIEVQEKVAQTIKRVELI